MKYCAPYLLMIAWYDSGLINERPKETSTDAVNIMEAL